MLKYTQNIDIVLLLLFSLYPIITFLLHNVNKFLKAYFRMIVSFGQHVSQLLMRVVVQLHKRYWSVIRLQHLLLPGKTICCTTSWFWVSFNSKLFTPYLEIDYIYQSWSSLNLKSSISFSYIFYIYFVLY